MKDNKIKTIFIPHKNEYLIKLYNESLNQYIFKNGKSKEDFLKAAILKSKIQPFILEQVWSTKKRNFEIFLPPTYWSYNKSKEILSILDFDETGEIQYEEMFYFRHKDDLIHSVVFDNKTIFVKINKFWKTNTRL